MVTVTTPSNRATNVSFRQRRGAQRAAGQTECAATRPDSSTRSLHCHPPSASSRASSSLLAPSWSPTLQPPSPWASPPPCCAHCRRGRRHGEPDMRCDGEVPSARPGGEGQERRSRRGARYRRRRATRRCAARWRRFAPTEKKGRGPHRRTGATREALRSGGAAGDGDAELHGLVDQVVGDAGAGEREYALRQKVEQFVVAPERGGAAVGVPVGLAHHLVDAVALGPLRRDALDARAATVGEHHVVVAGYSGCLSVSSKTDIISIGYGQSEDALCSFPSTGTI